ncbi:MAG TPA: hypothetical protein VGQ83_04185, partial [Polyangia bacterium]
MRRARQVGPGRSPRGAWGAAAVLLAMLAGCGDGPTGARVAFYPQQGVEVDQVALTVRARGTDLYQGQVPRVAGAVLQPGIDVVVLVDDALGGQELELTASGLRSGQKVAGGRATVLLRGRAIVTVTVALAPTHCPGGVTCAPGDCGTLPDGCGGTLDCGPCADAGVDAASPDARADAPAPDARADAPPAHDGPRDASPPDAR